MKEKGFALILILLGGLILAGLAGGVYYFGKINFSPQSLNQPHSTQSSSPIATPSPSATLLVWPSPVVTSTPIKIPSWKNFVSDDMKFSIEYPPSLSVQMNTYGDCPSFSDISNPQMKSADFMKQGHNWIVVCISSEDIPSTFSYSDTAIEAKNTTIKPYTVNGYSGIRGKTIYYLPGLEGDEVYLQNPVGGYASFDLRAGDVQIYDKMLSTFQFIDRNQGKVIITQGNVYFLPEDGKPKLIANLKDIKEQGGLFAFTDALLSPDHSKIRLLGQGGISSELLYYTRLNNISVKSISTAEEAVWSPSSRYIAYNSKVADAGGPLMIGVYDTETDKNFRLTNTTNIPNFPEGSLEYSNLSWESDNSGIKTHYLSRDGAPHGNILGEGNLVIPLSSFTSQQ